MDQITRDVSTCGVCQKQKKQHKKYGLLPEKEAEYKPWERLCIDLIGPYKFEQKMWSQNTGIKMCHNDWPSGRLVWT